jgi:hypothetical protein
MTVIPRFTDLSTLTVDLRRDRLRHDSTTARVIDFLRDEGGVWTSPGVADALMIPPKKASAVLVRLARSGLVRKVGEASKGSGGRRPGLYEAVE